MAYQVLPPPNLYLKEDVLLILKKTQKMADLRIKQAIMEEEKHEPWKKLKDDKPPTDKSIQLKKPELIKK